MYSLKTITTKLATARKSKGWNQTFLSQKSNLPQPHISQIEQGKIDLRLSTLIELCRLLDHELMIIPRNKIQIIETILNSPNSEKLNSSRPLYDLANEDDE